jgi:nitrite reductase/ring-hydroxylating ferredoxin subunit/uncharacterized membrane protein
VHAADARSRSWQSGGSYGYPGHRFGYCGAMSTSEAGASRTHRAVERLEDATALDAPAEAIAKAVRDALPGGPVKDALSGTWLGHALHPVLTDVPIGTWTSALLLDWLGGRPARPAADRLIGIGLMAALPTVAAGASDWADSTVGNAAVRRVGLVHATGNGLASTLFAASWVARRRGARAHGRLLALAAGAAMATGAFLGGHLSLVRGIGVDETAFDAPPHEWTDVLAEGELAEGRPRAVRVDGIDVMVVRDRGEVRALTDRCAHRGGPLHEGEVRDGCVTCPWHGSTFDLRDGSLVRGPSAYPQPAWEAQVREGRIELRPVGAA